MKEMIPSTRLCLDSFLRPKFRRMNNATDPRWYLAYLHRGLVVKGRNRPLELIRPRLLPNHKPSRYEVP